MVEVGAPAIYLTSAKLRLKQKRDFEDATAPPYNVECIAGRYDHEIEGGTTGSWFFGEVREASVVLIRMFSV